jgi:light-regulated signal transduction histidine kinase (bacteriophytochrome)
MKQLTEELRRSNEDLHQFASVVAHDLKTPLNGIGLFATYLAKHYKGRLDERADEAIHYIFDSVERTRMLISDLLAYSRINSRKNTFRPVNCSVTLEEAIFNLRSQIEESGAELTYDLLPTIHGDASQLISLFQNLISNAIKFRSKETPKIHISAQQKGIEWIFSVRDNGIGIESKFFDQIFHVFKRLHTSEEYEGTGIGLASSKKVVERHGGRIWVESEPGEGATFHFTIPVRGEV